jgi:hypothetical protein
VVTAVTAAEEVRVLVADPNTTLGQLENWIAEREQNEPESSRV